MLLTNSTATSKKKTMKEKTLLPAHLERPAFPLVSPCPLQKGPSFTWHPGEPTGGQRNRGDSEGEGWRWRGVGREREFIKHFYIQDFHILEWLQNLMSPEIWPEEWLCWVRRGSDRSYCPSRFKQGTQECVGWIVGVGYSILTRPVPRDHSDYLKLYPIIYM